MAPVLAHVPLGMTGTVGEVPIFLGAVYGGLVIGLTFTAFRVLHALFGGGRISDALLDALFYLLSGVIAALTLFRINGGSLRLVCPPRHCGGHICRAAFRGPSVMRHRGKAAKLAR